jgi:hypothetical protein
MRKLLTLVAALVLVAPAYAQQTKSLAQKFLALTLAP